MTTAIAKDIKPDPALARAALRISAVAEPRRLGVLLLLEDGPMNVAEMCAAMEIEKYPLLSQHLQILRYARMVETRRSGVHVYYEISAEGRALLDGLRPLLERGES